MTISLRKLFLFSIGLLPAVASAAIPAATYTPIAPIGTLTGTPVNLTQYLNSVFETTVGIAGILAVFMMVWCGIKLMGTGSVSGKTEAKQCIWNAIFGVLLAVGAWILLNTINPLLLKNDAQITVQTPVSPTTALPSASTAPNPTAPGCYFKYKDVKTGDIKFSRYDTCSACDSIRVNFQNDPTRYDILSQCYKVDAGVPAAPPASTAPPVSTVPGSVSCKGQAQNLCEGAVHTCTNSFCAQFNSIATANASGAATVNLLKAIILQESSCGQFMYSPAGACGPTQLLVSTANIYRGACGVSEPVTCGWLAN